jgi:HD-GYP domain-containing protein (c-di-GMP phosphodiesterase class II)
MYLNVRLVAVNRLEPGMIVERDVSTGHPGAVPLLRSGARVGASFAARLAAAGVHAVWIQDDLGEGIEPVEPLSPETRRAAERMTTSALADARQAIARGGLLSERTLSGMHDVASRVAAELVTCPTAALALQDLASANAYTHRHSMQVTVIGLLIAAEHFRVHGWVDGHGRRRYDDIESRLAKLGFGLLIHDIGKLGIPVEVLDKPGALTDEEWAIMRAHPLNGVALLPASAVSALAIAVVRSHHERWDGSGYPDGKAGEQIHVFPRIAAPADVFDAVTSERVYRAAMPPHVGVRIVREGAGTAFDPAVVESFGRVVMPFPVGHPVTLPDGREAVVASVDPADPDRPVVRFIGGGSVTEEPVDLGELMRPAAALAA